LDLGTKTASRIHQQLADCRQADTPARTHQQRLSYFAFQYSDLPVNGGVRNVQKLACPNVPSLFHHRKEHFQLTDLHDCTSCIRTLSKFESRSLIFLID
jgi:hypothetical protein